jgi:hypothetical protein
MAGSDMKSAGGRRSFCASALVPSLRIDMQTLFADLAVTVKAA